MRTVSSYRASQPHGWPGTSPGDDPGVTLGGHTTQRDFTFDGKPYRISLRGPDPRWQRAPADPEVEFAATLAVAFGAHYTFRYRGFRGREQLGVESYSVFVEPLEGHADAS